MSLNSSDRARNTASCDCRKKRTARYVRQTKEKSADFGFSIRVVLRLFHGHFQNTGRVYEDAVELHEADSTQRIPGQFCTTQFCNVAATAMRQCETLPTLLQACQSCCSCCTHIRRKPDIVKAQGFHDGGSADQLCQGGHVQAGQTPVSEVYLTPSLQNNVSSGSLGHGHSTTICTRAQQKLPRGKQNSIQGFHTYLEAFIQISFSLLCSEVPLPRAPDHCHTENNPALSGTESKVGEQGKRGREG